MLNQVLCKDCIDLMNNMKDDSVELTLTDIPYDIKFKKSNGLRKLDKGNANTKTFNLHSFIKEIIRVTKGSIYVFCSSEQASIIKMMLMKQKLSTRLCIWEKTNPSPMNGQHIWLSGVECCVFAKKKNATFNEHCKNVVWRFASVYNKKHPTQKPVSLFEYIIETSTKPDDVVFDPCCGIGTTAVAAKNKNRNFIVCDVNEYYVKEAKSLLGEKDVEPT